jgi:hypothetical protein
LALQRCDQAALTAGLQRLVPQWRPDPISVDALGLETHDERIAQ